MSSFDADSDPTFYLGEADPDPDPALKLGPVIDKLGYIQDFSKTL